MRMTTVSTTVRPVKYARLLLIPFWALGALVALCAILVLACWYAGKAGWYDVNPTSRLGGN